MSAEDTDLLSTLEQRRALLAAPSQQELLRDIRRGIEKESLRMDAGGLLARTPHPAAFGSALCHPSITTDFSEALLEFITPVSESITDTLEELERIHRFAARSIGDELLWNASMPCHLPAADDIPVAQYGSSHSATMKTRYRLGLGHRYGRKMQTIAGIHYNFSLPPALWAVLNDGNADKDTITDGYFGLIRNFRRYSWLLIYLFGAAPAVSSCFVNGQSHALTKTGEHTLYGPYATSLRMGDLGYQSNAQKNLNICYNHLDYYIDTLRGAITTSHSDYERFPGDEQLSSGLLQIENEFYSPIRPKRVTASGEIPLGALRRGGVEYIEVRCLDVNPLLPLGIDAQQIRFLDAFLLFCLCADSPLCDDDANSSIADNLSKVVNRGREPGLMLCDTEGQARSLSDWGDALLDDIARFAEILDTAHGESRYLESCATQRAKLRNPALTPSAQIVDAILNRDGGYHPFALRLSQQHSKTLRDAPLLPSEIHRFADLREDSMEQQAEMEASNQGSFDDYLTRFYEQYQTL